MYYKVKKNIDYDALAHARDEYQSMLMVEEKVKTLKQLWKAHRRSAIQLYKMAGLSHTDIRHVMLMPEKDK